MTVNWNRKSNYYHQEILQINQKHQSLLYSIWFYCLLCLVIFWDTIFIFHLKNESFKRINRKKIIINSKFHQFSRFLMTLSYFVLFKSSCYVHSLMNIFDKVLMANQRTKEISNRVYISPVIVYQYYILKFKEFEFIRQINSRTGSPSK